MKTIPKKNSHNYFKWQKPSRISIQVYNEWNGPHRIIIMVGAIRSGKTVVALATFIKFILNSPHNTFAIAGRGINALERNVVKPLLLMLNNQGITYEYSKYNQQIVLTNLHKTIHLFGIDNEASEARIKGFTCGGTLIDEVTVLPESGVQMLLSRNSLDGAKIFMTCNPTNPHSYVYTDFVSNQELIRDGEVVVYNFYLEDNKTLSKETIHTLKSIYPVDSPFYKRNILNEWVTGHGMIFDMFTDDNILHEYDLNDYHVLGVGSDYGTQNMTCYSLVGIKQFEDHKEYHVLDERYFDASREGYQQTDTQRAHDVYKLQEDYHLNMSNTFYVSHDAGNFKAELEHNESIRMTIETFTPNTLDCIMKLSQLIGDNTLKIHETCTETIKQVQSYEWNPRSAQRGLDEPLKENDHLIDSMRAPIMNDFNRKEILAGVIHF